MVTELKGGCAHKSTNRQFTLDQDDIAAFGAQPVRKGIIRTLLCTSDRPSTLAERPIEWVLILHRASTAAAFCHYALGISALGAVALSTLVLHPLTAVWVVLLSLRALTEVARFEDALWIALPLGLLTLLHGIADETLQHRRRVAVASC